MIIRVVELEDAEELLGIYSYYIKNTAITFECIVPSVEEFQTRIRDTINDFPYLVAIDGGKIVGYAYAKTLKARAAYSHSVETSIYVAKDCRRCGVGSILMDRLETLLRKQNVTNMYACIAVPNEEDRYLSLDSIRFHEHIGFKHVGEFQNCGYKFNHWYNIAWMEKIIGTHELPIKSRISFSEITTE